ncbi:hypothetical protein V866_007520 [Kwoniella sp. B9012]
MERENASEHQLPKVGQSMYFPPEIFTHIILHLHEDKHTLLQLSLTCKYLYDLVTPLLWQYISLTPWSNTYEKKYYTTLQITQKEYMRRKLEDEYEFDGSIGISPTHIHLSNSRLSELFNYVNVLDIEYHKVTWCRSSFIDEDEESPSPSPSFERLDTLHLRYNDDQWPTSLHPGNDTVPCRLLRSLRPTTLYIHVPTLELISRFHLPDNILNSVQHVILISGPRLYAIPEGQCGFTEPVLEALQTIKSLTILFEPSAPSPIMGKVPMANHPSLFNVSFISSITKCVNIDTPIHIVNAGYIEKIRHRGSTKSIEQLHQDSMEIIKENIELICNDPYGNAVNWSKSDIQKRKDNLIFQTVEEWIDNGQWEGKMKEREVMGWSDVISKEAM